MYGYVGLCRASMALYGYVWVYMAMHGYVGLCMGVYAYLGLFRAI